MKNKQESGAGKIAALAGAAVAIGATAYYFLGPKSKQHQKSAKTWALDAKKKIIQEVKKGKEITESTYKNIVDNVVAPYMEKGAVTKAEALKVAKTLKQDWKHIVKVSKSSAKKVVKTVKAKAK